MPYNNHVKSRLFQRDREPGMENKSFLPMKQEEGVSIHFLPCIGIFIKFLGSCSQEITASHTPAGGLHV